MRFALLILMLPLLAACGVAGDPVHPEQKNSFEQSLQIGTTQRF